VIDEGSGWFKILNTNSHLAIDVIAASTSDGTHIQQYTDNATEAQRFSISVTDSSDPTAFQIVNETVASVSMTQVGARPIAIRCSSGRAPERPTRACAFIRSARPHRSASSKK
jgi:hypothetical protein